MTSDCVLTKEFLLLNISWIVKLLYKKKIVREQRIIIHQWKFMAMVKIIKTYLMIINKWVWCPFYYQKIDFMIYDETNEVWIITIIQLICIYIIYTLPWILFDICWNDLMKNSLCLTFLKIHVLWNVFLQRRSSWKSGKALCIVVQKKNLWLFD